jgi:hypothetical protein
MLKNNALNRTSHFAVACYKPFRYAHALQTSTHLPLVPSDSEPPGISSHRQDLSQCDGFARIAEMVMHVVVTLTLVVFMFGYI